MNQIKADHGLNFQRSTGIAYIAYPIQWQREKKKKKETVWNKLLAKMNQQNQQKQ